MIDFFEKNKFNICENTIKAQNPLNARQIYRT